MMKVTTVGLDLAKSVFTLHGVDERGHTVLRKTVRRAKLLEVFARSGRCNSRSPNKRGRRSVPGSRPLA
jgi:transposase